MGKRLFEQEKKEFYKIVLKLWPLGEIAPKELYFLHEIDCGMLQLEKKNVYLMIFCEHQPREVLFLDEIVDTTRNLAICN